MAKLTIVGRDGSEKTVEGHDGWSVMETIRDAGFDELLALCGGCCSCATCHVHVDEGWLGALPAMGADEDDLLDSSSFRGANSRLSCQLEFGPELDGLRVTIAPED
ncbi:MAG: 2Fe-2S iron-sulfur cluster binding domain-containing protein [Alphaproteobacteria bacterium]|nr:MAG: 2Fe-2S iron-sulfur cluster binding domain-containing protein [Alphaproteobacteria bacterium]